MNAANLPPAASASAPVLIMAGGTGGHVFPALAVADELRAADREVVWLGTQQGLEARVVPAAGLDIEWITIAGVRGRGVGTLLVAPFHIARATWQALGVLRRRRPAAVLGMGGFVAGPGGLAAWLTRRPLLIHEQNAVAGTTNRLLARIASRVFEAFPDSFPDATARKAELIGNPVRGAIADLAPPAQRFASRGADPVRVLVLGGSQGARILNQTVPAAMAQLAAMRPSQQASRPQIRHQAGAEAPHARAAYAAAGVQARVDEFIEDMADAYAWADIVVARAGALTVAELCAAGVGAVLVPYPYATDDHQACNARYFVAAGAGQVIAQSVLTGEVLAHALQPLLADRAVLLRMAECARAAARPDAAKILAEACLHATAEGRS